MKYSPLDHISVIVEINQKFDL